MRPTNAILRKTAGTVSKTPLPPFRQICRNGKLHEKTMVLTNKRPGSSRLRNRLPDQVLRTKWCGIECMGPVHPWPPSWSIPASAGLGFFLCLVRWGRDRFSSGRNGPVSNLPVCYPRVPRPSFSAGPVRAAGPRFVGRLEPIRIRGQDSCSCVILGVLSPYSERVDQPQVVAPRPAAFQFWLVQAVL
jgi:hypothetical protein